MDRNVLMLNKCRILLVSFVFLFLNVYSQNKAVVNDGWDIKKLNTAANASYMKSGEKEMLLEINMLRSNPGKYITYIQPYLKTAKESFVKFGKGSKSYSVTTTYTTDNGVQKTNYDTNWHYSNEEELKAVESLIQEMTKLKPLSILQPSKGIYQAAKKHAIDQIPTGAVTHLGTDGSWPFDRIPKYAPDMKKGNENIVCGSNLAREALITLLIDSGIPGYGHRENLLNNEWTHAACFFVGEIKTGLSCNYWIQNFGAVK